VSPLCDDARRANSFPCPDRCHARAWRGARLADELGSNLGRRHLMQWSQVQKFGGLGLALLVGAVVVLGIILDAAILRRRQQAPAGSNPDPNVGTRAGGEGAASRPGGDAGSPEDESAVRVGESAPPVHLKELLQAPVGAPMTLELLRGKAVVLEFWGT